MNQLPRCSPTCLPAPATDEDEAFFEKHGVTFACLSGTEAKRDMRAVSGFPASWRLLQTWNRGDIEYITIVDEKGMPVANVKWCSKGAYDNNASMRCAKPSDRRLNMDAVEPMTTRAQFLVQTSERDLTEYYDAANRVYTIQEIGGEQAEIDAAYEAAIALGQKFPPNKRLPIEQLKSTRVIPSSVMAQGYEAIMTMQTVRAIRFRLPARPDLWLS